MIEIIIGIDIFGGFQLVMGDPQARWMVSLKENPMKIRMMNRGTPMTMETPIWFDSNDLMVLILQVYYPKKMIRIIWMDKTEVWEESEDGQI